MTIAALVLGAFVMVPTLLLLLSWQRPTRNSERICLLLLSVSYGWFLAALVDAKFFLGPSYSAMRFWIEVLNVLHGVVIGVLGVRLHFRSPIGTATVWISICWFVALLISHSA